MHVIYIYQCNNCCINNILKKNSNTIKKPIYQTHTFSGQVFAQSVNSRATLKVLETCCVIYTLL